MGWTIGYGKIQGGKKEGRWTWATHLIAEALSTPRGHDDQIVMPRDRRLYDVQLRRPELPVAPVLLQQRQQALLVLRMRAAAAGMCGAMHVL